MSRPELNGWQGTNLARVADFNEAVVLDAIRRSPGGLSRVEITRHTRLSAQTTSNITRRLLDEDLIQEGERIPSAAGKPRTLLTLNPSGRFALGIHLDPQQVTYVVLDFTGTVVSQQIVPLSAGEEPTDVITTMVATLNALIADSGIKRSRIGGLGIATPGPVDTSKGIVLNPIHLPQWHDVHLAEELREQTGFHVILDKDVVAAAVGERWAGATAGHGDSVFLYLSTGVGAGIISGDTVMRGAANNAGDIGGLLVDPDGPPCDGCGMRSCSGTALSPRGIIAEARACNAFGDWTPATTEEGYQRLITLVREGQSEAIRAMDHVSRRIAKAGATVANLIDASIVVLGGPTWRDFEEHLSQTVPPHLRAELIEVGESSRIVTGTELGENVVAVGAACLLLDQAFSPHPTTFASIR